MSIQGYVWWSIYVRTSSLQKLKKVHLPPIAAALEALDFEWQIVTEEENPGLFRMVNYQNLEAATLAEIIIPVLRRAYRLADGWSISGLHDLTTGKLRHVMGGWNSRKPSSRPPSLESIVFELEPGKISGMTADGGWKIVDQPARTLRVPDG